MPDKPSPRITPHLPPPRRGKSEFGYAELGVMSNFSFLHGASHAEELVATAAELGYAAIGIADRNTCAGLVRAHTAAREAGIPCRAGVRLEVLAATDGVSTGGTPIPILAYPMNRAAWGRLCRLLTLGKRRMPRDGCCLTLADLFSVMNELALIIMPAQPHGEHFRNNQLAWDLHTVCAALRDGAPDPQLLSVGLTRNYTWANRRHIEAVTSIARILNLPLIATNDVWYHAPARKPLQDVVTCIREHCTIAEAGFRLGQNAERYLKTPAEMVRLFREEPAAIRRTLEVAEMAAGFSLAELRYGYPDEICPAGRTPHEHLVELVEAGARERFPAGVPERVRRALDEEYVLIRELDYEKYFLTCHDIVAFARSRGILCQGRGAAANSAVCFCLGITSVDPSRIDLLFARFVSRERNEPPDIDIDFEHERREEVIQYIYGKYGRERSGLTCEVITYRYRSAVREVGKALGLSLEVVDRLARSIHRWTGCAIDETELRELGLDPEDATIRNTLRLTHEILGFPRHISQHVGGFIISAEPLCETVPIRNATMEDRTIIEWDKDDVEELGMLKIDVLGLGMLTCIRKGLELINHRRLHTGEPELHLHTIPPEDPAVYDMICAADTIGVFQIESRAQMSMLPRLKPRCFYDLVIEVAIVRPGPIQGNMVHPYLKRRSGLEAVNFPDEEVKAILGKTLGVPLFQEQAMRLAIVLAGFTPGEAEQLRRAMAAWKRNKEVIAAFQERILRGMTAKGYSVQFAQTCVDQIKGFSEYGFPESHAASFALLVYASAWLKRHYPAEFATALLNSQPMGFYAPAQIISDARAHGVTIHPLDVNESSWDCSLEYDDDYRRTPAVRLGLRLVRGLGTAQADIVTRAIRSYGKVTNLTELWLRTRRGAAPLRKATLQALARADAFHSLGLSRREAMWEIRALPDDPAPLDGVFPPTSTPPPLPGTTPQQEMFSDYAATGLSLRGHPIGFIREWLTTRRVSTAATLRELKRVPRGHTITVAGIAIVRQRPGTARGTVFVTLEDETGITNLIIRSPVFERFQKIIITSSCLLARGTLERVGEVIYTTVEYLESIDEQVLARRQVELPNRSYSY